MGFLPVLALTAAMLLWSSAFISLKYLLDFLHPAQIVFLRMLLASGCFLLFFKQLRHFNYERGDWIWLLIMVVAEPCLYFLFEASALQFTTAGQAGVITATLPLLVSIAAFLILKERVITSYSIHYTKLYDSGVFATGYNLSVALFTLTSVACADKMTAINNSNGDV